MTFNNKPQTVSPFTSDRRQLANSIFGFHADGGTALYDAVDSALDYLKQGKHRKKVLVVITDGGQKVARRSQRVAEPFDCGLAMEWDRLRPVLQEAQGQSSMTATHASSNSRPHEIPVRR